MLAVLEARDQRDFGVGDFTRRELLAQWRDPEFVPEADSVVAPDGADVAGYGTLVSAGAIAFVDPAREGEGIGSALLAWLEDRARQLGRHVHRQAVAAGNAPGLELL
ncbi:MAG TPA: GNAT family N-acetyltransferase [Solirubrobacteraceae bacterium]|nr:GNAT family N-acetyltransferase [Solirubrobacteraceae bacterium]